jgi:hypothetical protein
LQLPYFASADNADHFLLSETNPRHLRTPNKEQTGYLNPFHLAT